MKSLWLVAVLLSLGTPSQAASRSFFLKHYSWLDRCGLIFTGADRRNEMYAEILEKTKVQFHNPAWHILPSVPGALLAERYGLEIDLSLAYNEVHSSEDYFFDVQNELIKLHGPNEPRLNDQLVLAVASVFGEARTSIPAAKVAQLIVRLSSEMGYAKALRWLTSTLLSPNVNLQELWSYPLVQTARKPESQWEVLSSLYTIAPSSAVAGAKTNQAGFLSGDRFELSSTLVGLINRALEHRVTGDFSMGAPKGALSPARVIEELEVTYGSLAFLLLTGQTTSENVRWALQRTQTKLNELTYKAFASKVDSKLSSAHLEKMEQVKKFIETFGGSLSVLGQR